MVKSAAQLRIVTQVHGRPIELMTAVFKNTRQSQHCTVASVCRPHWLLYFWLLPTQYLGARDDGDPTFPTAKTDASQRHPAFNFTLDGNHCAPSMHISIAR